MDFSAPRLLVVNLPKKIKRKLLNKSSPAPAVFDFCSLTPKVCWLHQRDIPEEVIFLSTFKVLTLPLGQSAPHISSTFSSVNTPYTLFFLELQLIPRSISLLNWNAALIEPTGAVNLSISAHGIITFGKTRLRNRFSTVCFLIDELVGWWIVSELKRVSSSFWSNWFHTASLKQLLDYA